MRALVFHGHWDIGVEERPDPRPGRDEVLIRITATGICGSDIHGFTALARRASTVLVFPGGVPATTVDR